MVRISFLPLAALALMLVSCGKKKPSAAGLPESGAATRTDDLPADPEEKFRVTYVRAAQAFSRNDLETALKFVEMAEQAKPGQANTANLRGAIFTRKRDWPNARAAFEEALRLQPDLPMAQFNLGEVLFLNNQYAEARQRFQNFLNGQPNNDLGLYKIFLCDLLGGQKGKAESFLASVQPSPTSPLFYFSKAAEAFVGGDKAEATRFVESAYRIYPADANATFADSLVEKGFLSGEQTGKIQEEGERPKASELGGMLPEVKKDEKPSSLLPAKP